MFKRIFKSPIVNTVRRASIGSYYKHHGMRILTDYEVLKCYIPFMPTPHGYFVMDGYEQKVISMINSHPTSYGNAEKTAVIKHLIDLREKLDSQDEVKMYEGWCNPIVNNSTNSIHMLAGWSARYFIMLCAVSSTFPDPMLPFITFAPACIGYVFGKLYYLTDGIPSAIVKTTTEIKKILILNDKITYEERLKKQIGITAENDAWEGIGVVANGSKNK